MRHSDTAWIALGVGVLAYDMLAKNDEQLSQGADRHRDAHPILVYLAIGATAAHLTRLVPHRLDIFRLFDLQPRRLLRRSPVTSLPSAQKA